MNVELEEANSRVVIAECTAENRIEVEKRKCSDEIATIQHIARGEGTIKIYTSSNICCPRDVSLSDSKCWNGRHECVN